MLEMAVDEAGTAPLAVVSDGVLYGNVVITGIDAGVDNVKDPAPALLDDGALELEVLIQLHAL